MESKSYQQALRIFRATPAYQQAAADLLVPEAKWIAARVGISESISADPAEIGPPGGGISGTANGSNYFFDFSMDDSDRFAGKIGSRKSCRR